MTSQEIANQLRQLASRVEHTKVEIELEERSVVLTAAIVLENNLHYHRGEEIETRMIETIKFLKQLAGTSTKPYKVES